MAGLQRPRAPRGPRRAEPAAGAGEVPGHLRLQPRRVLPGPRLRADGAGRRREREALVRRAHRGRAAGRHPGARPGPGDRAEPALRRGARRPGGEGRGDRRPCRDPGAPRPPPGALPRGDLPGPHAARRGPRPPVPVHQHAQPLARAHGGGPRDGRAALRPDQGPADPAAPGRGDARPLRPPGAGDRGEPGRAVPGRRGRRGPHVPGHPRRRLRRRGGRGRRPPLGHRAGAPTAALRLGRPPRGRGADARDDAGVPPVRDRPRRRRPLRSPGHARPDVALADRHAGHPGAARSALDARRARPARPGRRGRARGRLRRDSAGRPPRPPPLRVVHRVGRALHHPGGRRPGRPLDQADALPDVGRLADRARPDPGGRPGQAGRRARRDQGPLRRGGEHRLGAQARAGGRPRRLRPRRPQDAQQGGPRRAPRGHRPAPLPPPRDGQLQPEDRPPLHRPRAAHLPSRARRRRNRPLQLPDRPLPPGADSGASSSPRPRSGPGSATSSSARPTTPAPAGPRGSWPR